MPTALMERAVAPAAARGRPVGGCRPLPGFEAHQGPPERQQKCVNPCTQYFCGNFGAGRLPRSAARGSAVSAPPTPTRSAGCTCSAAPGHAPSHRVRTVQADPYVRTQNTGARGSPLGTNLLRADRARCGIGRRRVRQPPLPLLAFAPSDRAGRDTSIDFGVPSGTAPNRCTRSRVIGLLLDTMEGLIELLRIPFRKRRRYRKPPPNRRQ